MAFAKKLIILSNAASANTDDAKGLLSIEKTVSGIKGSLTLYNLPDSESDDYRLLFKGGDMPIQKLRLGKGGKISKTFPIGSQFDINGKICATVLCGKHALVYGSNSNTKLWQSGLMDNIDFDRQEMQVISKTERVYSENAKTIDLGELENIKKIPARYDDSAIAAINYYSLVDDNENAKIIADVLSEPVAVVENEPNSSTESINERTDSFNWDNYNNIVKKQREQLKREKVYSPPSFYSEKYVELKRLFDNYPLEEVLTNNLNETVWVRVDYSDTQYYVVGLIGKEPDYIAYGIPGKYSLNPPRELAAYCSWLAINENDMYGEGYWMMYQDAENGECVKITPKRKQEENA